ncbi:hypothetical protein T492DRAFT_1048901 [Pavlovales sp. CCMP2436]|nr:hypothetical protein T492DRAFT_1048901 [Pavlovales sp. CCMP2436]|mmetsp:Transcript_2659/g.6419  ORF Transcript_2659/g.6419 Transcript_2659/m.6419 type:complete len:246 (+) Transcript_2659:110-847(+)
MLQRSIVLGAVIALTVGAIVTMMVFAARSATIANPASPGNLARGTSSTTLRHNNFELWNVTGVSARELAHDITSGQPFGGVSAARGPDLPDLPEYPPRHIPVSIITVLAGRKASEPPAISFVENGLVFNNVFMMRQDGNNGETDALPARLNFWVRVHLKLEHAGEQHDCGAMMLGQGSYRTGSVRQTIKNDWWIGGKGCYTWHGGVFCQCDKAILFFGGVESTHAMWVSVVSSFDFPLPPFEPAN